MIDFFVILNLATVILILIHSIKLSGRNFFEPIYYFLLGFAGVFVVQVYTGQDEIMAARDGYYIFLALFLSWFSLLLFYAGYRSRIAKNIFLKLPQPPRDWKPGKLIPYGLFLIVVGIAGQLYFISFSGGAEKYFGTFRGAGAYETTTAYIYRLQWLAIPGLAILFVEIARKSYPVVKPLCYGFALFYLAFQFWSGQRSAIFLLTISILAWYYLPRIARVKIPLARILLGGILALSLVGFVANFRNEFYLGSDFDNAKYFFKQTPLEQAEKIYTALIKGGKETVISGEFDGFIQTLEAVPDHIGYDYGHYYTKYLYQWIPRIIWPKKPTIKGEMREFIEFVPAFDHETITMFGMYYLNFGLFGVFICSFVTGIFLGGLEYWRKSDVGNLGILIIYLVFFQIGRTFLMVAGIFEDLDMIVPFSLLPCLGAFWYLKGKRILSIRQLHH